jgi:hypothetical protein
MVLKKHGRDRETEDLHRDIHRQLLDLQAKQRCACGSQPGPIPAASEIDAYHIAIATVHGMDFLLTWNCSHIANAAMRSDIEMVCRSHGYEPPVIRTPQELMEAPNEA